MSDESGVRADAGVSVASSSSSRMLCKLDLRVGEVLKDRGLAAVACDGKYSPLGSSNGSSPTSSSSKSRVAT